MNRLHIYLLAITLLLGGAAAAQKPVVERPDLEKIKEKTTDETSMFYYPKLLEKFMRNDSTSMTNEEYRYFYYGTLFQEDYDPYRPPFDAKRYEEVLPLYYKTSHTNAEKDLMLNYAVEALKDNPVDLEQLKYRVIAYDEKKKDNLRNIWRSKLNRLLYAIASSGTGLDPENAWVVVYPSHEFDFLNMQGFTVTEQEYVDPHYERVSVKPRSDKEAPDYYFDLGPMLEQYYLKHPSESQFDDE